MQIILFVGLILQGIFYEIVVADYQNAYNKWKADYEGSESNPKYCPSCMIKADQKAVSFRYTSDEKYAVRVINLYTQEPKKTEGDPLYRTLNKQIREKSLTNVMTQYKDLLFLAIGLLNRYNKKDRVTVYRGSRKCHDLQPGSVKYNTFTSTSSDPTKAFSFGCEGSNCKFFTIIKGATGLSLDPYSAFPNEKEILLINGTNIDIKNIIEDEVEIITQMEKFWPSFKSSGYSVSTFLDTQYTSSFSASRILYDDDLCTTSKAPAENCIHYLMYSVSIYITFQINV